LAVEVAVVAAAAVEMALGILGVRIHPEDMQVHRIWILPLRRLSQTKMAVVTLGSPTTVAG
jgi:hypothetical protein